MSIVKWVLVPSEIHLCNMSPTAYPLYVANEISSVTFPGLECKRLGLGFWDQSQWKLHQLTNYLGSANLIFLWKTQKLPFFQTPCKVRMDVLVQFSFKPITITSRSTRICACLILAFVLV